MRCDNNVPEADDEESGAGRFGPNSAEVERFIVAVGALTDDQWTEVIANSQRTSDAPGDRDLLRLEAAMFRGQSAAGRASKGRDDDFHAGAATAVFLAVQALAKSGGIPRAMVLRLISPFAPQVTPESLGVDPADPGEGEVVRSIEERPDLITRNIATVERFLDALDDLDEAGWSAAAAVIEGWVADGTIKQSIGGSDPRYHAGLACERAAGIEPGKNPRRGPVWSAAFNLTERPKVKPHRLAMGYAPFAALIPLEFPAPTGQHPAEDDSSAALAEMAARMSTLTAAAWRSIHRAVADRKASAEPGRSPFKVAKKLALTALKDTDPARRGMIETVALSAATVATYHLTRTEALTAAEAVADAALGLAVRKSLSTEDFALLYRSVEEALALDGPPAIGP